MMTITPTARWFGAQSALPPLRCIVCKRTFDFASGETAVILRHVAYYNDFVHDGDCLVVAREQIFPEPDYDCAAFGIDPERVRILRLGSAAVHEERHPGPTDAESRVGSVRYSAVVEHSDGSCRLEEIVRDAVWQAEPGGAEFLSATPGVRVDCAVQAVRAQKHAVGAA
jgi:hypothetical protein